MRRGGLFTTIGASMLLLALLGTALGANPKDQAGKLEQQRQKLEEFVKEEGSILDALEKIDRAVQEKETTLEQLRVRQAAVEKRIAGLEKERADLQVDLAKRRVQLQKRLRALYKYSTKGFMQAIFAGGSGSEILKRTKYLNLIVRRDMELLQRQRGAIERFSEVKRSLETEQLQVKSLALEVEAQVTASQEERLRKQALLKRIQQEKSTAGQTLRELEAAAAALARRVEALPMNSAPVALAAAPRPGTPLTTPPGGAFATVPGTAPGTAPGTVPVAPATPGAPAAPAPAATASIPPPESRPTTGFAAMRGRLAFPTDGKVTKAFGRYKAPGMKAYDFHRGIDVTAPIGIDFRALYGGEVKLAEWFKGYGLLLIIDHGDGFHSIYAHASKLFKKAGDKVKTGERVGQIGDTGSFQGPYLYLEIREKGKPVNPLEWIRVPPDAMALE